MATATLDKLTEVVTGSKKWVASPWDVYDCHKCCGNGKYRYDDGTFGQCYPCDGSGMLMSNQVDETEVEDDTRYVSSVTFKNNILTVYYIVRCNNDVVAPVKKQFDVTKQKNPKNVDDLRLIFKLAPNKVVD